jgi:hypothetical protein
MRSCDGDPRSSDRATLTVAERPRGTQKIGSPSHSAGPHSKQHAASMKRSGSHRRERELVWLRYAKTVISSRANEWSPIVCDAPNSSEQFRHYRRWILSLQTGAGRKVVALLLGTMGVVISPTLAPPNSSPSRKIQGKTLDLKGLSVVEAGGIEPPSEDLQEMATTRLVREFELSLRPPTNGLPKSQPI